MAAVAIRSLRIQTSSLHRKTPGGPLMASAMPILEDGAARPAAHIDQWVRT